MGAREPIFEKRVRAPAPSTTVKNTWLKQCKKRQIQAPGTTFSTFSDAVRLGGGHRNCCRFAALTGEHQGAHIPRLPCQISNFGSKEKFGAKAKLGIAFKEKLRGRGGSSCLFDCLQKFFLWAMQRRWCLAPGPRREIS